MKYYLRLFTLLLIVMSNTASARVIASVQKGDWSDPNTWNQTTAPVNGDTVVVSAGDTVRIWSNITLNDVWVQVYGHMYFRNSRSLTLEYSNGMVTPASMITFYSGFFLFGGNGSSGISFGSGGSGCDLYRPASGSTPGQYPSIGSYYDGCTWGSFLSAQDLWTNARLFDKQVALEWELNEPVDAKSYIVIGGSETGEQELSTIRANGKGEKSYYHQVVDVAQFEYFRVEMTTMDRNRKPLYSVTMDQIVSTANDADIYPNPFNTRLYVADQNTFDVQLVSMEGKVVIEAKEANHYILDTENIEPGIYFLQVMREGRLERTEKVVRY